MCTAHTGLEYGSRYWGFYLLGQLCSFCNGAPMPMFGLLFKEMMEVLVMEEKNKQRKIVPVIWIFMGVGGAAFVFGGLQGYFWGKYG